MKSKKIQFTVTALMMMFIFIANYSFATIHNVSATSSNTFVPSTVNAVVGDTIRWTRTGGTHTTTCDGQQFTSRPSGAAPWNALLTAGSPTFVYVISVAGTYNYICEPHAPSMAGVINATASGINQITEIVNGYKLSQNFPNPFNPVTNIEFSIPNPQFVSLKVFNIVGKEVASLVNENLNAGSYSVDYDATPLTSGVYFYRINAGNFTETKRMTLIK